MVVGRFDSVRLHMSRLKENKTQAGVMYAVPAAHLVRDSKSPSKETICKYLYLDLERKRHSWLLGNVVC